MLISGSLTESVRIPDPWTDSVIVSTAVQDPTGSVRLLSWLPAGVIRNIQGWDDLVIWIIQLVDLPLSRY